MADACIFWGSEGLQQRFRQTSVDCQYIGSSPLPSQAQKLGKPWHRLARLLIEVMSKYDDFNGCALQSR